MGTTIFTWGFANITWLGARIPTRMSTYQKSFTLGRALFVNFATETIAAFAQTQMATFEHLIASLLAFRLIFVRFTRASDLNPAVWMVKAS